MPFFSITSRLFFGKYKHAILHVFNNIILQSQQGLLLLIVKKTIFSNWNFLILMTIEIRSEVIGALYTNNMFPHLQKHLQYVIVLNYFSSLLLRIPIQAIAAFEIFHMKKQIESSYFCNNVRNNNNSINLNAQKIKTTAKCITPHS